MSPTRMSKIETAIRTTLEFNRAFNRHDIEGMLQLMSEDCILESSDPAPDGVLYSGKEQATTYLREFFHEQPNISSEIEEAFGLGEHCILRWKNHWDGPSDKKKSHVRGVDIFLVRDGLIREKLSYVKG